jgi:hypothetical protein
MNRKDILIAKIENGLVEWESEWPDSPLLWEDSEARLRLIEKILGII